MHRVHCSSRNGAFAGEKSQPRFCYFDGQIFAKLENFEAEIE